MSIRVHETTTDRGNSPGIALIWLSRPWRITSTSNGCSQPMLGHARTVPSAWTGQTAEEYEVNLEANLQNHGLTVSTRRRRDWYGSNRLRYTTPKPRIGNLPNLGHSTFWDLPTTGVDLCEAYGWSSGGRRRAESAALAALAEWCRKNLHLPIREQHQKLTQKLRGHYGYYGIIGNYYSLQEFREGAREIWRQRLSRRRRGKPNAVVQILSSGGAIQSSPRPSGPRLGGQRSEVMR